MADQPTGGDEVLKLAVFGGPDAARSAGAYASLETERAALQTRFAQFYTQPAADEIRAAEAQIHTFAQSGAVGLLIPMGESGPVIKEVLDELPSWVRPENILVVDDGSDDQAVMEVARHEGVRLVRKDAILDTLVWERILPLINLPSRPGPKSGKGVAVLAGLLLWYYLATRGRQKQPQFLMLNDADIKEYAAYQALQHLVMGLRKGAAAHYIKMAKHGRGNEVCMAARSLLDVLANWTELPEAIRARAAMLFEQLVPDKWMLAGEFMMDFDIAMRCPIASGYLLETMITAFMTDIGAETERPAVRVANPNSRIDRPNTPGKEMQMQLEISRCVLRLAGEKPVSQWTPADLQRINQGWLAQPSRIGWIQPDDNGPVRAEVFKTNRMLLSVRMLQEGGFIDELKVGPLVQQVMAVSR